MRLPQRLKKDVYAAATVRDFLARELQYPQRLRWTVLSSADELFRAAR